MMEGFEKQESDIIRFAVESEKPWKRIIGECKKYVVAEVAKQISLKTPDDVDDIKMNTIQRVVDGIVEDLLSEYSRDINMETIGWAQNIASATSDIEMVEKGKGRQLSEILEKSLGENLVSYVVNRMKENS